MSFPGGWPLRRRGSTRSRFADQRASCESGWRARSRRRPRPPVSCACRSAGRPRPARCRPGSVPRCHRPAPSLTLDDQGRVDAAGAEAWALLRSGSAAEDPCGCRGRFARLSRTRAAATLCPGPCACRSTTGRPNWRASCSASTWCVTPSGPCASSRCCCATWGQPAMPSRPPAVVAKSASSDARATWPPPCPRPWTCRQSGPALGT